jgi:hypothetical protein
MYLHRSLPLRSYHIFSLIVLFLQCSHIYQRCCVDDTTSTNLYANSNIRHVTAYSIIASVHYFAAVHHYNPSVYNHHEYKYQQQQGQRHIHHHRQQPPPTRHFTRRNRQRVHRRQMSPSTIHEDDDSNNSDNIEDSNDNEHYYYWNETQLMAYANDEGIKLSMSKVGPLVRAMARTNIITTGTAIDAVESFKISNPTTTATAAAATVSSTILLGYVEGFVRPSQLVSLTSSSSIFHLDKMEVFQKQISLARKNSSQNTINTNNENESLATTNKPFRNGGTILGVGLLLGYLCVLDYVNHHQHPPPNEIRKSRKEDDLVAEFLAIDDEPYQHARLVKYYTTAGFVKIKYVGDDWTDIPDRLIWGGCGTLLRQSCVTLLCKWTKLMERSLTKRQEKRVTVVVKKNLR